ncbi:MAG: nucleotidyltransferase domain-containing protein [Nanoarchaeota archaeon]
MALISKENQILELFYENQNQRFTIREIAKTAKIPRTTAHRVVESLKKQGLINKENSVNENLLFKTKKINFFIEKIVFSGLIEELINKLNPSCIILFGSVRKGESIKESDIDLFVESQLKKHIDLSKFEKKIGHKIQLFIEPEINKLQKNLFNNVVNGIKIYGAFNLK